MEKLNMRRNRLFKRLNGFQKAHRKRFLLLTHKRLTEEEFVLYELGIALAIWDEEKEEYGSFEATNQELANILGWKSDTTALRHKGNLIKKGFFRETEDNTIKPIGLEEWRLRKPAPANLEDDPALLQNSPANLKKRSAKIEENQPQNSNYPLGSFKDNLGSYEALENITDDELDHIAEELFGVEEGDKQDE